MENEEGIFHQLGDHHRQRENELLHPSGTGILGMMSQCDSVQLLIGSVGVHLGEGILLEETTDVTAPHLDETTVTNQSPVEDHQNRTLMLPLPQIPQDLLRLLFIPVELDWYRKQLARPLPQMALQPDRHDEELRLRVSPSASLSHQMDRQEKKVLIAMVMGRLVYHLQDLRAVFRYP